MYPFFYRPMFEVIEDGWNSFLPEDAFKDLESMVWTWLVTNTLTFSQPSVVLTEHPSFNPSPSLLPDRWVETEWGQQGLQCVSVIPSFSGRAQRCWWWHTEESSYLPSQWPFSSTQLLPQEEWHGEHLGNGVYMIVFVLQTILCGFELCIGWLHHNITLSVGIFILKSLPLSGDDASRAASDGHQRATV